MKHEIDTLSSPQGKTVIFRNLDESGQRFVIKKTLANSDILGEGQDTIVSPPDITYEFYMRALTSYSVGEIDHSSPLKYSDLSDGEVITAQPGFVITSEGRQLVDMSNYLANNPDMYDKNSNITDAVKDYFKSVSATNLASAFANKRFSGREYKQDRNTFLLLDTSQCTSLHNCFKDFGGYGISSESALNLTGWNVSKVTDISSCFESLNWVELDITGWDTSGVTNASKFLCCINSLDQNKIYGLEGLNLSNCENLTSTFDFYLLDTDPLEYLNLQKCKISNKCKDMTNAFYRTRATIIDITGWDTSGVTSFQYMMRESPCQELRGTLDMASAIQSWKGYSNMVNGNTLTVPIKIKNPPSASDWWQTAGFTSEDQFEIVT